MGEATRGSIRAAHTPGGNITIDTTHTIGGLIRVRGDRRRIEIERADLDDAIAALQALRGGSPSKCWGCDAVVAGDDALDVTMRCAACRAKINLPPTEEQSRYAPVAVPPAVLAAAERNPDIMRKIEENNDRLIAFLRERLPPRRRLPPKCGHAVRDPTCRACLDAWTGHSPAPGRPIERYVRAAVPIPGTKGRTDGTIEIGLHYERRDPPHAYRDKLIEVGEVAARVSRGRTLDEDTADLITADLDERIVHLWGDRPRFIEIWRGTGDDAEPLTQVYAPHGLPIAKPRADVIRQLRYPIAGVPVGIDQIRAALLGLLDELGAE